MIQRPLIVDVKRFSLDDGPGIRSVVFFKGCPLRCFFCHNPETRRPYMEIAFSRDNCIECGSCEKVCPRDAIDMSLPGRIIREQCDRCGTCADVCPGEGLQRVGAYISVESLTEILIRDSAYYRASGGGVTLSGGECTMFPSYVEQLLISLKSSGVHVAIETSGYFNFPTFRRRLLPYLDLIYYDVKLADDEVHRAYTGRPNRRILENLRLLMQSSTVEVTCRIPLVPGITAREDNLSSLIASLRRAGASRVVPLPYNPAGIDKYPRLGIPSPDLPYRFMKPEEEKRVREILIKAGCRTHPGDSSVVDRAKSE